MSQSFFVFNLLHVKVQKNLIKRIEWKNPLNKWQSWFYSSTILKMCTYYYRRKYCVTSRDALITFSWLIHIFLFFGTNPIYLLSKNKKNNHQTHKQCNITTVYGVFFRLFL